jgi:hypothetical protein
MKCSSTKSSDPTMPDRFIARRLNDTSHVWVVVDEENEWPPWPFGGYSNNRLQAESAAAFLNEQR